MRRTQLALSCLLAGLWLAVGCSGPLNPPAPPGEGTPGASNAPAAPTGPTAIDVPSIGAHSTLIPLGLNPDGTVQVPDVHHPEQAGWVQVDTDTAPNRYNPVVILGHVDGDGQPGVFSRLSRVKVGATVTLAHADDNPSTYTVTRVQQTTKDQFPRTDVYGPTDQPEIRLVTCGGGFNRAAHAYTDAVIAYATLTPGPK